MTSRRLARALAAALALLGVIPASAARTTTVYLARHAEKAAEPKGDPALSEAGLARADVLAAALEAAGVQAILVSQYQRTHLTAAPLASRRGLVPAQVEVGASVDEHAQAVATRIRRQHRGEAVLVVGHSNTVPAIVRALGVDEPVLIADAEYSHLLVVTLRGRQAARLARLSYGAPD